MLPFTTKTDYPPYKIIGERMIFSKKLDEPFENYHRTILNYLTLSVNFSLCRPQELTFTKNINCIVITADSILISIFPKHMMYASITTKYILFHGFNKYIERMVIDGKIIGECPINLPKNMTLFSGFSFEHAQKVKLNSKLITYNHFSDIEPIILPKKLRYLTISGCSCYAICEILMPPNLKFLYLDLLHYLDEPELYCQLGFIKNPLTTFVITDFCDNQYTIDNMDTIKHVYIDPQFKLPNMPCKSIIHYNPIDKIYELNDNEYFVSKLVVGIIGSLMFSFGIGILTITFYSSVFYDITSEFVQSILLISLLIVYPYMIINKCTHTRVFV